MRKEITKPSARSRLDVDRSTPVAVAVAVLGLFVLSAVVIASQAFTRSREKSSRDSAEAAAPSNRELSTRNAAPNYRDAVEILVQHAGRPGWPTSQPAPLSSPVGGETAAVPGLNRTRVKAGIAVFQRSGCVACHTVDGKPGVGPSLLNIVGSHVALADGTRVLADADYIRESIRKPAVKVHRGYAPVMPDFGPQIQDREVEGLLEFFKSISPEPQKRIETLPLPAVIDGAPAGSPK